MNGKRWGPSSLGWDNNVSDHEMCTVYKDTTENLFITRCAYAQGRVKRLSPSIYIYVCVCVSLVSSIQKEAGNEASVCVCVCVCGGKKHGCLLSYRSKIATK